MKNLNFRSFLFFVCSCIFTGCNDSEDMFAYMDGLIHNYVNRTVELTIDGEKVEIPEWTIGINGGGRQDDEQNFYYDMNLQNRQYHYDYTIGHRKPLFSVLATLSGNDVVFFGNEVDNTSEYKMSVEGRLTKIDATNDVLCLDIKRTTSDNIPLAHKTYLVELSEDAVDVNDFMDNDSFDMEGEKIAATDYIRKHPLSFYFKCLQEAFGGYKTLKLSFEKNNLLTFEGKNEQTGQFVPIEGECRYFLVDSKSGYIEMEMNSALSNISKNWRNMEEWRNVLCIPFDLKFPTDGKVQFSLEWHNIGRWVYYHEMSKTITEEEFNLYYPMNWWNNSQDKLWLEMTELK